MSVNSQGQSGNDGSVDIDGLSSLPEGGVKAQEGQQGGEAFDFGVFHGLVDFIR